MLNQELRE